MLKDLGKILSSLEQRELIEKTDKGYKPSMNFYSIYISSLNVQKKNPRGRKLDEIAIDALTETILYTGQTNKEEIINMAKCLVVLMYEK